MARFVEKNVNLEESMKETIRQNREKEEERIRAFRELKKKMY